MQDEEGKTVRYENGEKRREGDAGNLVEIDCSTGPRCKDFIVYFPTSLTFSWYFWNARYDRNLKKKNRCQYDI